MAKGKKQKGTLYNSIPAMAFFPLFLFGLISLIFTLGRFAQIMSERVSQELAEIADSVLITYDIKYPGKYELKSFDMGDATMYALMKGDTEITGDNTIINRYKNSTQAEITVYYKEIRMITTLRDDEGKEIVGTVANQVVIKEVLDKKKAAFYPRVNINGHSFCCYYSPILTDNGACIGMIAVAKPSSEISVLIAKSVTPYALLIVAAMALSLFISHRFANSLAIAIKNLNKALAAVARGELSKEPDYSVMNREDEIGEMGRNVVSMQRSLHILIERDALTELYNRRLATKRLNEIITKSEDTGTSYCVCLGDIDFFKKVNDTYGHESGDNVLKAVSAVFKKNMAGKGFAARWGGEEFLLVFEDHTQEQAVIWLGRILDEIRAMETLSENMEDIIKVTMTFGVVPGTEDANLDTLVRKADMLLYEGKTNGRNRIVYKEEEADKKNSKKDSPKKNRKKDEYSAVRERDAYVEPNKDAMKQVEEIRERIESYPMPTEEEKEVDEAEAARILEEKEGRPVKAEEHQEEEPVQEEEKKEDGVSQEVEEDEE